MPFVRRHLIQFAAASLATLALGAAAQSYPTKPVTLMVPYSAGGLSDNIARRVNVPLAATLASPPSSKTWAAPAARSRRRKSSTRRPTATWCFRARPTN